MPAVTTASLDSRALLREARFIASVRLFDDRGYGERMARSRRRDRPLQARGTVPHPRGDFLTATDTFDDDVEQQQLRQPEAERADAGDHVEIRKLHCIIGNAARHSS